MCWNAEPQRWCDFIVPTFNNFIMNHSWTLEKVYLKNAFVCPLSKLLKTCSPGEPLMHQIKRKEQNNYMAVWNRQLVYGHTTHFLLHSLISRFHDCFIFPGPNGVWTMRFSLKCDLLSLLIFWNKKLIYNAYNQHIILCSFTSFPLIKGALCNFFTGL